ncbi:MAG: hypothetical protein J3Q66DRAFT_411009 [Benniella sp.]|nr:MAG: hypothetical protein J3Q66DRAFT_407937 [Benniella sp.]KAK3829420.1 MAG: hypothetical protein J3Q66DRAFT_411009 [Benniella sp.]
MVAVEDYEPLLDDALTYMPFRDQSKTIPRKLQGCIIQSRKDVLLCLKVEVYGRSPDEDPQAIPDLVTPDVRSFKVVNELFGGANQVMIGTSTWNALVTMTVILNHGEPATLATLWKFKHDAKGWSGVKLAALIFHTIYLDEELKKKEVTKYLESIPKAGKSRKDDSIRATLEKVIASMNDNEKKSFSQHLSRELKSLAEIINNEQSKLNKEVFGPKVSKTINDMNSMYFK